jgi:hypothetical protein
MTAPSLPTPTTSRIASAILLSLGLALGLALSPAAAQESNRNRGAALALAGSGTGWTLLTDMAEYWRVNSSCSAALRVRVRGCRSLSCPTVSVALIVRRWPVRAPAEMVDMRAGGPSYPGAGICGANDTPARWECRIAAGGAAVGMQPQPADAGLGKAEVEGEFDG